jgi:hypothetical protein
MEQDKILFLMFALFGIALSSEEGRRLLLNRNVWAGEYIAEMSAEFAAMGQARYKTAEELASEGCVSRAEASERLLFNYTLIRNEMV